MKTLYEQLTEEQRQVLTDGTKQYPLGVASLQETLRSKHFIFDLTLQDVVSLSAWYGCGGDVSAMFKLFNK